MSGYPVHSGRHGRRIAAGGFGAMLSAAALLVACARMSPIASGPSLDAGCERYYAELDRLTDQAGVRDAGAHPVPGASYLRSDRFLASFAGESLGPEQRAAWLERLRRLDAASRRAELSNLGQERVVREVFSPFPALNPGEVVAACGRRLVARDLAAGGHAVRLKEAVAVPDAYSAWRRLAGFYPLTLFAAEWAVEHRHRRLREAFARPLHDLPRGGRWLRYPPPGAVSSTPEIRSALLERAARNPLAIPDPPGDEGRFLLEAFAPIWEIDTASRDDRIGAVEWRSEDRPAVRVETPVTYRFVTHTRFHGKSLLQLNYLIWFPARTALRAMDLDAGKLDGLIWRVTLTDRGAALAYDTIHAGGCCYQLFPGLGYRVQQPGDGSEPVLSPLPLLPPRPGERLVVRIAAHEHDIEAVYPASEDASARPYAWRAHDELLALKQASGRRRSVFGPEGLVPHTERLGRLLLWPSGIASPGAMRRIGTHAIALTGRRHFDDSGLLDTLLKPL